MGFCSPNYVQVLSALKDINPSFLESVFEGLRQMVISNIEMTDNAAVLKEAIEDGVDLFFEQNQQQFKNQMQINNVKAGIGEAVNKIIKYQANQIQNQNLLQKVQEGQQEVMKEAEEMVKTTEDFKNQMESRARILKIIAGVVVGGLVWMIFGKYIMMLVDVGVSAASNKNSASSPP